MIPVLRPRVLLPKTRVHVDAKSKNRGTRFSNFSNKHYRTTDNLYSLVYAEEEYLLVGYWYCHADKFRYRYQYLLVTFSLEIQEVILPSRGLSKRHEDS